MTILDSWFSIPHPVLSDDVVARLESGMSVLESSSKPHVILHGVWVERHYSAISMWLYHRGFECIPPYHSNRVRFRRMVPEKSIRDQILDHLHKQVRAGKKSAFLHGDSLFGSTPSDVVSWLSRSGFVETEECGGGVSLHWRI